MKLVYTCLALSSISSSFYANAFSAGLTRSRVSSSLRVKDTADAVEAAMDASKVHGEQSPEAKLAWELVEELDASNSHERKMKETVEMRAEKLKKQRELAVKVPRAPTVHIDTSEAVKDALEASRLFGKTSSEAKIAWDIVEELDAANSHHTFEDIHVAKPVEKVNAKEPVTKQPLSSSPNTVEEAINVAMFAKKIYGIHSAEARTAWDVVEEMDAAISDSKRNAEEIEAAAAAAKAALQAVGTEEAKESIQLTDTSAAIKVALEASKEYGKTSVEAKMAWEAVEEIDSANAHRKTVGTG